MLDKIMETPRVPNEEPERKKEPVQVPLPARPEPKKEPVKKPAVPVDLKRVYGNDYSRQLYDFMNVEKTIHY